MRIRITILKPLFVVCSLAIAVNATAQRKSGMYIETNPAVSLEKGGGTTIDLNLGYMWKLHHKWSLGLGAGVMESTDFDEAPAASLFFRTRYAFQTSGKIVPFVMVDIGSTLFIDSEAEFATLGFPVSPTIGCDFGHFYVGLSYRPYIFPSANYNSLDMLALKLGWNIGGRNGIHLGNKASSFFKSTYLKAEVGYNKGLTSFDYTEQTNGEAVGYKIKHLGFSRYIRLAWMYRIDDHWDVGIGTGLDWTEYETNVHDKDADKVPIYRGDNTKGNYYLPIYARAQYNIGNKDNDWRPFVACDLGGSIRLNDDAICNEQSGVIVTPQVGVTWKRLSLSTNLSLTNAKVHDYWSEETIDTKTSCGVGVRLGVTI